MLLGLRMRSISVSQEPVAVRSGRSSGCSGTPGRLFAGLTFATARILSQKLQPGGENSFSTYADIVPCLYLLDALPRILEAVLEFF